MVDIESLTLRLEYLEMDHWVRVRDINEGNIIQISGAYYRMKTEVTKPLNDDELYSIAMEHIKKSVMEAREITQVFPLAIEIQYPIKDDK